MASENNSVTRDSDKPHSIATLAAKDKEAHILSRQGKHSETETILRANLESRRNILNLSDDDPLIRNNLGNLGAALNDQNKCAEAEMIHRDLLEQEIRINGLEREDTIADFGNLAEVYSHQGHFDKAIDMQKQALALATKVWGGKHVKYLLIQGNYANTLARNGEFVEAVSILRQVADGFRVLENEETQLGGQMEDEDEYLPHDNYLRSLNNLASVLARMGKSDEAIRMFKMVVEQEKEVWEKQSRWVISV